MNKLKNSKNSKLRRLKLDKETVVHLTDAVLKQVVGGGEDPTQSWPISACCIP